jgi:hypothetical protein
MDILQKNGLALNHLTKQAALPSKEEQVAVAATRFPRGRQSRPVLILAIKEGSPFRLQAGDVFPSITAIAKRLGLLSTPPVHTALKNANGAPATLRGVTCQYLNDYQKGKAI